MPTVWSTGTSVPFLLVFDVVVIGIFCCRIGLCIHLTIMLLFCHVVLLMGVGVIVLRMLRGGKILVMPVIMWNLHMDMEVRYVVVVEVFGVWLEVYSEYNPSV